MEDENKNIEESDTDEPKDEDTGDEEEDAE